MLRLTNRYVNFCYTVNFFLWGILYSGLEIFDKTSMKVACVLEFVSDDSGGGFRDNMVTG